MASGGKPRRLINFALDTGGWAFHDNNDLLQGLREVASAPDAYYYLAYVPANMKFDGHFHSLKVTLLTKDKYSIQARRGYFAPLHGETPEDVARRDVDDAVFSQEERHGVPVGLQTQYYKTNATDAKLAVLAHVDLAHVRFTKADGRNQDDLTVVAAIFDRDGNFVTGTQRIVSMKLRDETFQKLSRIRCDGKDELRPETGRLRRSTGRQGCQRRGAFGRKWRGGNSVLSVQEGR